MEVKIEDVNSLSRIFKDSEINERIESTLPNSFYQRREIFKLPPSAKFILFLLKLKGPLNRKRIIQETIMPDRTVGFALKKLLMKNLIQKVDIQATRDKSLQRKRRKRKLDRRVTYYNLSSGLLPFGEIIS